MGKEKGEKMLKILKWIQYRLIKSIAGKCQVVINSNIKDGYVAAKPHSIFINNIFTETQISGKAEKEIKIELFKDKSKKWRFRLVSRNKKILCSSEAYSRKCYCKHTVDLIRKAKRLVVEK